ncbi:hypothetical protein [Macrococcus sp. DPC7161]|uniref:hypothetical protein n=1 Tax=Macrococcus sp. DPC7161 TaxID=2507060 RepID=UPI00100C32F8|nr:hypothetical protein [Macrococcus sp. DPC7161]RXK17770.1 hypothetical protein ER639_08245 [Macrococcus sp. DPC7161]
MILKLVIALLLLIGIFIFFIKYLTLDAPTKVYDERKQRILIEVFSNTLIYLIAIWFIIIIFKTIGFKNLDFDFLNEYKEVANLGLTLALLVINYISINKKYNV